MHSVFLSKKRLYLRAFLFVHVRHPSSTSKDDDKSTEKDPETNAYGQFSPVFNAIV